MGDILSGVERVAGYFNLKPGALDGMDGDLALVFPEGVSVGSPHARVSVEVGGTCWVCPCRWEGHRLVWRLPHPIAGCEKLHYYVPEALTMEEYPFIDTATDFRMIGGLDGRYIVIGDDIRRISAVNSSTSLTTVKAPWNVSAWFKVKRASKKALRRLKGSPVSVFDRDA